MEPFSIVDADKIAMVFEFIRRLCEGHFIRGQRLMSITLETMETSIVDEISLLYRAMEDELIFQLSGTGIINSTTLPVRGRSPTLATRGPRGSLEECNKGLIGRSQGEGGDDDHSVSMTAFLLSTLMLRTITELCEGPDRENQAMFMEKDLFEGSSTLLGYIAAYRPLLSTCQPASYSSTPLSLAPSTNTPASPPTPMLNSRRLSLSRHGSHSTTADTRILVLERQRNQRKDLTRALLQAHVSIIEGHSGMPSLSVWPILHCTSSCIFHSPSAISFAHTICVLYYYYFSFYSQTLRSLSH